MVKIEPLKARSYMCCGIVSWRRLGTKNEKKMVEKNYLSVGECATAGNEYGRWFVVE